MKKTIALSIALLFLSGCSTFQSLLGINYSNQQRSQSSIVEYLYPNNRGEIKIKPDVPRLSLPLRVGIAFVPEGCGTFFRHDLNEELKTSLLANVSRQFETRDIIEKVDVIPSTYLRRKGSFTNLRDIKQQFNIDVVVLLSYDQVQYTEKNILSAISYWTIVGRYVIEGEQNDSITLINATIYDIDSEKLLFDSSGYSTVKSQAASAFMSEEMRLNSQKGFALAIDDLIGNLDQDLDAFKEKVREKKVAVVHYRSGGGGATGLPVLLLMGFLGCLRFWSVRRRND